MINSFDYSQYYYSLEEICEEKERMWGDWKKRNARMGSSSVDIKLIDCSQKGGFCLTSESIGD